MSVPNVEQFIDMLISIPAEGYENSFVYVLSEWTKQQGKHLLSILLTLPRWQCCAFCHPNALCMKFPLFPHIEYLCCFSTLHTNNWH